MFQDIGDNANDIDTITEAIENAKNKKDKPSIIIIRSNIGYGAPDKQDTPEAHGSPLGKDEIKATKEFYDWPSNEPFYVPEDVLDHMREAVQQGEIEEITWNSKMEDYRKKYLPLADEFQRYLKDRCRMDGMKIFRTSNRQMGQWLQGKLQIML